MRVCIVLFFSFLFLRLKSFLLFLFVKKKRKRREKNDPLTCAFSLFPKKNPVCTLFFLFSFFFFFLFFFCTFFVRFFLVPPDLCPLSFSRVFVGLVLYCRPFAQHLCLRFRDSDLASFWYGLGFRV